MRMVQTLLVGLMFFASCKSGDKDSKYLRWVGDIEADENLDDPSFELCFENLAKQYFNFSEGLQFEGERYAINQAFTEQYDTSKAAKESGLIRIRFMVNCKGQSGRFRLMGMDFNYEEKKFDSSITSQLMTITKGLEGWKAQTMRKRPRDYYQYLIFKIENGVIKEIMP